MALVALRLLIGPLLLLDALDGKASTWFLVGFVIAGLSDFVDGKIARRLGVASRAGAMADSYADLLLYSCVLLSACLTHADICRCLEMPAAIGIFMQLLNWAVSLAKFGKLSCYHSQFTKAVGIALFFSTIALFAFGYAGLLSWLALPMFICSNAQEIAMTLILPRWVCDVSGIQSALYHRQRRG